MSGSALIIPARALNRVPDELDPGPAGDLIPWYLHPNPQKLIGTGYLCSRCGRPFVDLHPVQIWERPETGELLAFRHKRCKDFPNKILYHAVIRLSRRLDGRRWYHGAKLRVFDAWIRSDKIAEPSFLQDFEVRNHQSALRGGILPNDYTVVRMLHQRAPDNSSMVEYKE